MTWASPPAPHPSAPRPPRCRKGSKLPFSSTPVDASRPSSGPSEAPRWCFPPPQRRRPRRTVLHFRLPAPAWPRRQARRGQRPMWLKRGNLAFSYNAWCGRWRRPHARATTRFPHSRATAVARHASSSPIDGAKPSRSPRTIGPSHAMMRSMASFHPRARPSSPARVAPPLSQLRPHRRP